MGWDEDGLGCFNGTIVICEGEESKDWVYFQITHFSCLLSEGLANFASDIDIMGYM